MAYNKAKEEYRWNQWKAEEEKILREQGADEETIQKLREYDWDDFNAERRFREHQTSLLDCMELLLEEKETKESQPESVEALLDTVENEELLQILLSTDKKTLQMIVLKMMGYAPKEISHHMELPEQTLPDWHRLLPPNHMLKNKEKTGRTFLQKSPSDFIFVSGPRPQKRPALSFSEIPLLPRPTPVPASGPG